jgi:hypothetical protein
MTYEPKDRSNFVKHVLDFADSEQVLGGRCVTFVDDRFDYGEERLVSLGLLAGRVVIRRASIEFCGQQWRASRRTHLVQRQRQRRTAGHVPYEVATTHAHTRQNTA